MGADAGFLRRGVLDGLWGAYSRVYDGLLRVQPYRHLLSMVAARLGLVSGQRVLDLGCGTGNNISAMHFTAAVQVTGVDSSRAMLNRAQRKVGTGAVLVHADLLEFLRGCRDGAFERISAVNVLYAVEDRPAVWRECLRVLGDGGRIVAVVPDRGGRVPIIKEHMRNAPLAELLRPSVVGVALIDWLICALSGAAVLEFPSQATLEREITGAGGTVISVERCYGGIHDGIALLLVIEPGHGLHQQAGT